ncbi:YafY family transcriptional regulator [Mycoplasmatota bacterium]|nr:YafY family transcriptional regulator [Mycoplasmatota bacterium]
MRLHRLIAIILLVESRGVVKAKEIASALEVSIRTIYRDIETLCQAGIPLMTTTGKNGGISFVSQYSLDLNHFYGDEVIQLYLTGMGIRPINETETKQKLQNALFKLEANLPDNFKSDIIKVKKRIYYDETPWWGEIKKIKYLELIRKAVIQSIKLKITYLRYQGDKSKRIIEPYGIVSKQLDWYLIAYDEYRKEIRTFKCERIVNIETLSETFRIPDNFSLESYWKNSENRFKKEKRVKEIYPVTVKVNKDHDFILKDLEILDSKLIDNKIIAVVNLYKYEFACIEALEIAGFAEIVEPLVLREHVKTGLTKILAIYK